MVDMLIWTVDCQLWTLARSYEVVTVPSHSRLWLQIWKVKLLLFRSYSSVRGEHQRAPKSRPLENRCEEQVLSLWDNDFFQVSEQIKRRVQKKMQCRGDVKEIHEAQFRTEVMVSDPCPRLEPEGRGARQPAGSVDPLKSSAGQNCIFLLWRIELSSYSAILHVHAKYRSKSTYNLVSDHIRNENSR